MSWYVKLANQRTIKLQKDLKFKTALKERFNITSICSGKSVLTLIVRSPEAETIYLLSKSTTLTAARWATSTRRTLISRGEIIPQTAIERSFELKFLNPQLFWHFLPAYMNKFPLGRIQKLFYIEKAYQVTIMPFWKRKCKTASTWCISVCNSSPVCTSHTLQTLYYSKI